MTKKPITPNSQIKGALRKLWLRSRERAKTLKDAKYTCQGCGRKQTRAKGQEFLVEVHHKEGVLNWDEMYKAIRRYLLTDPDKLEVLCKECHDKKHKEADNE